MDITETSKNYAKGAIIGGIIGGVFALITKRRVVFWGGIGLIAGGYITHKLSESKVTDFSENNFKIAE